MQPTHRRGYPSCHRCRQAVGSPQEPRPAPLTLHPSYYDASGDGANRHTPNGYERQGQRRKLWATIIRHRGRRPGDLCRVLGRRRIAEFNKGRKLWATIIRHRGRRPGGLCRVLGRRRIAEFNKGRKLWATIIRHRGRRPGGLCRVLGRRRIAEFNRVGPRDPVAADIEVC